jgi:hypothetical protein
MRETTKSKAEWMAIKASAKLSDHILTWLSTSLETKKQTLKVKSLFSPISKSKTY